MLAAHDVLIGSLTPKRGIKILRYAIPFTSPKSSAAEHNVTTKRLNTDLGIFLFGVKAKRREIYFTNIPAIFARKVFTYVKESHRKSAMDLHQRVVRQLLIISMLLRLS